MGGINASHGGLQNKFSFAEFRESRKRNV